MKSIERLLQYIDYKGVSKRAFELNNGLSNGYLGKQMARNADLGEGILTRILENCPDLSSEWLLTGKGEMIVPDMDVEMDMNLEQKSIKKPSQKYSSDGLKDKYILLLERTIRALEEKINDLNSKA